MREREGEREREEIYVHLHCQKCITIIGNIRTKFIIIITARPLASGREERYCRVDYNRIVIN